MTHNELRGEMRPISSHKVEALLICLQAMTNDVGEAYGILCATLYALNQNELKESAGTFADQVHKTLSTAIVGSMQ